MRVNSLNYSCSTDIPSNHNLDISSILPLYKTFSCRMLDNSLSTAASLSDKKVVSTVRFGPFFWRLLTVLTVVRYTTPPTIPPEAPQAFFLFLRKNCFRGFSKDFSENTLHSVLTWASVNVRTAVYRQKKGPNRRVDSTSMSQLRVRVDN